MFEEIIRKQIAKRADEFLSASEKVATVTENLSSKIDKLCSLIEGGHVDTAALKEAGITSGDMKNVSTASDKLGKTYGEYTKKLIKASHG